MKKIVSKLLLATVVLTLISFCFLGNTFARYTKEYTGSAQVTVAKWEVERNGEIAADITFNNALLSPSMAAAPEVNGETIVKRSNSTTYAAVAQIINRSDVSAKITAKAVDTATITLSTETRPADWTDRSNDAQKLFTIKLYTHDGSNYVPFTDTTLTNGQAVIIYAKVVWTSNDTANTPEAIKAADELDTWVGEYVTSVKWNITYTAVQASEQH